MNSDRQTTTAVVEHAMSEDDLTHPCLYRFKRNNMPCHFNYHPKFTSDVPSHTPTSDSWDLYPSLIREIENEGSPEQVEKLHQMQRTV
ncbi:uncharacterized protein B0P05DRAFT_540019 [Gilbertella persicaria]|uniref:Uncharacterized protein n=1 Tax=Rhizopus stolonifer TaxID=4846 RepID=A0A367KV98_RHIST|nr:uncharacterized protein B0P05DRAFT_540019 [Gilbertella persicaria]KAI8080110.1 hypothetical protein B0P05DRAFT_540019 [Gilbertella persicaria]RCI06084.1 hypothetical protein CU098_007273 [Rhizopus stolonifer]